MIEKKKTKKGKIEVRILADYKCPKCGKIQKQLDAAKEHFCPDCGAKMNMVPEKSMRKGPFGPYFFVIPER